MQNIEGLIPGSSSVDDEREIVLMGQLDLLGKGLSLKSARRMVVEVIKAGFADGYHPW